MGEVCRQVRCMAGGPPQGPVVWEWMLLLVRTEGQVMGPGLRHGRCTTTKAALRMRTKRRRTLMMIAMVAANMERQRTVTWQGSPLGAARTLVWLSFTACKRRSRCSCETERTPASMKLWSLALPRYFSSFKN